MSGSPSPELDLLLPGQLMAASLSETGAGGLLLPILRSYSIVVTRAFPCPGSRRPVALDPV